MRVCRGWLRVHGTSTMNQLRWHCALITRVKVHCSKLNKTKSQLLRLSHLSHSLYAASLLRTQLVTPRNSKVALQQTASAMQAVVNSWFRRYDIWAWTVMMCMNEGWLSVLIAGYIELLIRGTQAWPLEGGAGEGGHISKYAMTKEKVSLCWVWCEWRDSFLCEVQGTEGREAEPNFWRLRN